MNSHEINGTNFYGAVLAGLNELGRNLSHINNINVFPVADGDTGTNMYATLQGGVMAIRENEHLGTVTGQLAEGAVLSSRGNSGAILSTFFATIAENLKEKTAAGIEELVSVFHKASLTAVQSVQTPAKGTILDAMHAYSVFLESHRSNFNSIQELLSEALPALKKAVEHTTEDMPLLKKAGVVDAGAEGFYCFINGFTGFICNPVEVKIESLPMPDEDFHLHESQDLENIQYRYCTEAVIKLKDKNILPIESTIAEYGDSFAKAATGEYLRFHVHTNNPGEMFEKLYQYGEIISPKAEDMIAQASVHLHKKYKTAIVVDSSCDLPPEIIEDHQIFVVPINILFGNSQFLDKVTLSADKFYSMAEKAKSYPTTSQPNAAAFENLYRFLLSYFDEIVSVHISSHLSGTMNSAKTAADKIGGSRIHIVDSKNLSTSFGLAVFSVLQERQPDWNAAATIDSLEKAIARTKMMVSVKTMKYMARSGRVNAIQGLIARLLNIRPVVSLDTDGKSALLGKGFSRGSNLRLMIQEAKERQEKGLVNYFAVGHAHEPDLAAKIAALFEIELHLKCSYVLDIAPVIGLHAGRGSVSVALV